MKQTPSMSGTGFPEPLHCADIVDQFLPALAAESAHAFPHLLHSDGFAGLGEVGHPALALDAVVQGTVHLLQLLVDDSLVDLVGGGVDEGEKVELVEDVTYLEFCLWSEADFLQVLFVLLVDDFDPRSSRVHCKINYIHTNVAQACIKRIRESNSVNKRMHYAYGITFITVITHQPLLSQRIKIQNGSTISYYKQKQSRMLCIQRKNILIIFLRFFQK